MSPEVHVGRRGSMRLSYIHTQASIFRIMRLKVRCGPVILVISLISLSRILQKKKPGEFRVIITGGSAAQGVFLARDELTMPRQFERHLNELAPAGRSFKVINLAMAGSHTLQNYIALNLWAHQMNPDIIISFSGRNDILVPYTSRSDLPVMFQDVMGMVSAIKEVNGPEWLRQLEEHFPNLVRGSSFAAAVRLKSLGEHRVERLRRYREANHPSGDTYLEVVQPFYTKALKSIKRDFLGVPIAVVFQPLRKIDVHAPVWGKWMSDYQLMRTNVPAALDQYLNDDWYFLDLHDLFRQKEFDVEANLMDDTHFTQAGGELVGKILAKWLIEDVVPIINSK